MHEGAVQSVLRQAALRVPGVVDAAPAAPARHQGVGAPGVSFSVAWCRWEVSSAAVREISPGVEGLPAQQVFA